MNLESLWEPCGICHQNRELTKIDCNLNCFDVHITALSESGMSSFPYPFLVTRPYILCFPSVLFSERTWMAKTGQSNGHMFQVRKVPLRHLGDEGQHLRLASKAYIYHTFKGRRQHFQCNQDVAALKKDIFSISMLVY